MRILKTAAEGLSFLELLLDETLCAGAVKIDKELVRQAGGVNRRLNAKQKYELILRIAKETPVEFVETGGTQETEENMILEEDATCVAAKYGWQTDCYVLAKYCQILLDSGCFDAAVGAVMTDATGCGRCKETMEYLESMLLHQEAFYRIDDATRPILIYKGDEVCHNILTVFAEEFGAALCRAGEHVIYFDLSQEEIYRALKYKNRRFKAVVGMQSCMFSVKMADETHYLHEYIYGPKFNFIFDHPIWVKSHMEHSYNNYYILTHDENYVAFAERYFHKKAVLFPPAGMTAERPELQERIYDLTFVGTYGDYMEQILWIHQLERPLRFLANRFLLMMRRNPNCTLEDAFARTLEERGMKLDDEMFAQKLYEIRRVVYCVMHNYRSKVIKTILESGVQVDVFGDSWFHCPLRRYPNLICHPDVTVEESLEIWRQSKLSLNIMSWHKGGFTERMAGIMLAGAVLVTDDTTYLHGRYDEDNLIIFCLDRLEELPAKILSVLADEPRRIKMAQSAQRKTKAEHTWDKRAVRFLEIWENL